jgi:RNA polymerase sigma factor (sigma-70 family)
MPEIQTESESLSRQLAEARFSHLYAEHWRDLLEYAVRRLPSPEDAAEVVEETFLVAWRLLTDVPDGGEARLWLYGVARHALANQRRGERRRARLADRLAVELSTRPSHPPPGPEALAILAALRQLEADDREVLLLAGWEELEPREIARVLEISPVACRSRLFRARRRLQGLLADRDVQLLPQNNELASKEES